MSEFKGPNVTFSGGTVPRPYAWSEGAVFDPDLASLRVQAGDPDEENRKADDNVKFAAKNNGGPTIQLMSGHFRWSEDEPARPLWCARLSCSCGFFEIHDNWAQMIANIPGQCMCGTTPNDPRGPKKDCLLANGALAKKYERHNG